MCVRKAFFGGIYLKHVVKILLRPRMGYLLSFRLNIAIKGGSKKVNIRIWKRLIE